MSLTKSDKIFIESLLNAQGVKFEDKLDDLEQKFEDKLFKFRDDFYTKIDPILKEVIASREDRTIGAEQHRRNEDRIEKLEKINLAFNDR